MGPDALVSIPFAVAAAFLVIVAVFIVLSVVSFMHVDKLINQLSDDFKLPAE